MNLSISILETIIFVLEIIVTILCSGVVVLAIGGLTDIIFGEHKHFEKIQGKDWLVKDEFDYFGLFVCLSFLLTALTCLILLVK